MVSPLGDPSKTPVEWGRINPHMKTRRCFALFLLLAAAADLLSARAQARTIMFVDDYDVLYRSGTTRSHSADWTSRVAARFPSTPMQATGPCAWSC